MIQTPVLTLNFDSDPPIDSAQGLPVSLGGTAQVSLTFKPPGGNGSLNIPDFSRSGCEAGPSASLGPGTEDFQISFYFYLNTLAAPWGSGNSTLYDTRNSNASGTSAYVHNDGQLHIYDGTDHATGAYVNALQWYKFKIKRVSGTISVYLNDAPVTSYANANNMDGNLVVVGGAQYTPVYVDAMQGYVGEFSYLIGTAPPDAVKGTLRPVSNFQRLLKA